jgi:long-chain-fatty-acid--[acyl-carrier-protein] ligase
MWLLRLLLTLRYRIHREGSLPKTSRPIIIFSSLSSQIDPLLIASVLPCSSISSHPQEAITQPWLRSFYRYLGWDPLPDWDGSRSPFARRRFSRALQRFLAKVQQKKAYLFFPVGHLQRSPRFQLAREPLESEVIGPISPPPELIYAEVRGMLGSFFSAPEFGGRPLAIQEILWMLLKNGLFFMPRRTVTIEFKNEPERQQETVQFVPHFRNEKPATPPQAPTSQDLSQHLLNKIAELSQRKVEELSLDQNLYQDLQLDSLDVTELIISIYAATNRNVPFENLETVKDVLMAAEAKENIAADEQATEKMLASWSKKRPAAREPEGTTIPEAFLAASDEFGSHLACVDNRAFMSYKRLKTAVIALAESLRHLPGEKVGIILPNSAHFNIVVLALLFVGKVPVLLNWTLGVKHLEEAARLAGVQTVLSNERFIHTVRVELPLFIEDKIRFVPEIINSISAQKKMEALRLARISSSDLLAHFGRRHADDPAALLFTSGTEGRPKGVVLSHRNILANQRSLFQALDFNKNDVFLGILPPFHVYGFSVANLLPILIGCRAVFAPILLDFEHSLKLIQHWGVTVLPTTPTFLKALLQISKNELDSVRLFCVGAEKAPEDLFKKISELPQHPLMVEGYGTTECSPCLTLTPLKGRRIGVGPPLPGVKLAIVDPATFQQLPSLRSGLVCANGDNVFQGYLGGSPNPFIKIQGERWYKTGDLGHLERDGSLVLDGRLSRTVKIGGEIVHLQELELIIQKNVPAASLAIVAEEGEGRTQLILLITESQDLLMANRYLADAGLSNLLRLHEVRHLKELPRLSSGKIDYRKLEKFLKDERESREG